MANSKEYKNIFSLVDMFSSEEKVSDFFTFFCENTIRQCNIIKNDEKLKFYPVIYSKEHETLSISFNFFIDCIAKYFDPGNTQAEEMICADLKIGQKKSIIAVARKLLVYIYMILSSKSPYNTKLDMT